MHGRSRLSWIGLLGRLGLSLVLGAVMAMTGAAAAGDGWDATWHGGFDNGGDGVQVIVTGGQVLGFYFHGDYIDTDDGTPSPDGAITFHWDGGAGTLSDDGGKHRLTVRETGKPDRVIPLERDK